MKNENDFVASEIRKSGYPLEIEIAELLERHDWQVRPSVFYRDHDNGDSRETDIIAYKSMRVVGSPYCITIALMIECKKRGGMTWIFFPRPRTPNAMKYEPLLPAIDSFTVARVSSVAAAYGRTILPRRIGFDLPPKAFVSLKAAEMLRGAEGITSAGVFQCLTAQEKSLSYDVVKLERSTAEENKERQDRTEKRKGGIRNVERGEIYRTLTGLGKSLEEGLVNTALALQQMLGPALDDQMFMISRDYREFDFFYFFLVLIIDGKLKVWKNGTVTDANEVLHQVSLRSSEYSFDRFVCIVRKEHFDPWLTQFERDSEAFTQSIMGQRSRLDRQVEYLLANRIKSD